MCRIKELVLLGPHICSPVLDIPHHLARQNPALVGAGEAYPQYNIPQVAGKVSYQPPQHDPYFSGNVPQFEMSGNGQHGDHNTSGAFAGGPMYQDHLNNRLRSTSPQHSPDMRQPSPYPFFGAHQTPVWSMRAGSVPQNFSSNSTSSRGETPYRHFAGDSGSEASSRAPSVVPGSEEYQAMMLYSMGRQPATHLPHVNQNVNRRNGALEQSPNLNETVAYLVTEVKRLTEHAQHTDKELVLQKND
ncbi:uncharacterized protein EDB91DRAFT_1263606 [Suillus paluster]|uniref:uncharacterized protein n=1 Tax=Suillus paluster TaxID=48578 RepID=UPI001B877EB8|nr:uncharacterized protein EDB91DRAFT_1263606 [Suillus paluster]KAG1726629.1 hypothetical protein EDB91DRAFT_1263606 [Suillus paluster]